MSMFSGKVMTYDRILTEISKFKQNKTTKIKKLQ